MQEIQLLPVTIAAMGKDDTLESISTKLKDKNFKKKIEETALKQGLFRLENGELAPVKNEYRNEATDIRENTKTKDIINQDARGYNQQGERNLGKTSQTAYEILKQQSQR